MLDFQTAYKEKILIITNDKKTTIFSCSISNLAMLIELKNKYSNNYQLKKINLDELNERILSFYFKNSNNIKNLTSSIETASKNQNSNLLEHYSESDDLMTLISSIINNAILLNASDIHIIPSQKGSSIFYRINGIIENINSDFGSKTTHQRIINRIKILANLDIIDNNSIQDGSFKINYNNENIFLRVNIAKTNLGFKTVIRIFQNNFNSKLSKLNFHSFSFDNLKNLINKPSGLIIFSGTTGSGKTTSIYSLIQELKEKKLNIITIEDPVEKTIKGISQIQVSSTHSYIESFKATLRQDPDVIVIGEIRDIEIAKLAVNAAYSGHLVISSLHAGSVFNVIRRLVFMIQDKIALNDVLKIIVHQELKLIKYKGKKKRVIVEEFLKYEDQMIYSKDFKSVINPDNYLSKKEKIDFLIQSGYKLINAN